MSTGFGIKTLWAGWKNEPYFGFSDQAYKQWKNEILIGSRILVYEALKARPGRSVVGVQSIVAEVEVTTLFDELNGIDAPTEQHPHLIGVNVLRARGTVKPIPNERICEILNTTSFPNGFPYRKLDEATYLKLLQEWDR